MTHTPAEIAHSHLVADTEAARTAAHRAATDIDRLVTDLHHAISNGRTGAALSLLASIDRSNLAVLDALKPPTE